MIRSLGAQRARLGCATVILAILAVTLIVPSGAPAGSSVELQWWPPGKTAVGEGFHIRIPVTVVNDKDYPLQDALVLAEIDVTNRLIESGWIKQVRAGTDMLRAFELDAASVRVIEMTNFDPPSHGSTSGLLKAHDSSLPAADAKRYEVPSVHFEGFLTEESERGFDGQTNPIITVAWPASGVTSPGSERFYVVYLDSLTNREHEPSDHRALLAGGALDRAFWMGPATDLLGFVSALPGQPGTVQVFGIHDGTTVSVYVADSAGNFFLQPPGGSHQNPFTIERGQVHEVFIGQAQASMFRLVADRPVLAQVASEGFIPSTTGGVVGNQFLFATTYRPQDMQDSLFLLNRHPSQAPTVVRLESLTDGSVQQVHLSDAFNQFPYTVGAHALKPQRQGAGCVFPPPDEAPAIPTMRRAYRATVESGGPVAVQFQPVMGVTPLAPLDGATVGTDFWSALSRSEARLQGGECLTNVEQYAIFGALTRPGFLELKSDEFPPCSQRVCPLGTGVATVPAGTLAGETFTTPGATDRPIQLLADAPGWLMVSPDTPGSLADASVRGPLPGGDVGRVFTGLGPGILYAPFKDTVVHARLHFSVSGAVTSSLNVPQGRATPLPAGLGTDVLLWYVLESNRPLMVLPLGASPGFLPGIPSTLAATAHSADYRGHLVEIRSVTGLNPAAASTVPGGSARYVFEVTNRGRGAGAADLPDSIDLSHDDPPAGWSAALSRTTMRLGSGETQTVELTVSPASGTQAGQLVPIKVTAQSRGNPRVADTADTVTHVKRSFDVGLWFDHVEGPKSRTAVSSAGETIEYPIALQNRGSVTDRFAVTFTQPDAGWDVRLLHDGAETFEVELAALQTAQLVLDVHLPQTVAEGLIITTVEARSLSSSATLDRIVATSKLRAPSELVLITEDPTVWVRPGQDAIFNLTLRNDGLGTADVHVDLQHDHLPSWSKPTVFLRTPQAAERPTLDRVSLGPGQALPIGIAVRPGGETAAGERASIRFAASSISAATTIEDFLAAIVMPIHDIRVDAPDGPVRVSLGGVAASFDIGLENRGNLVERLRVLPRALPSGWIVSLPADEVVIPRNGTQTLTIHATAPPRAAEGRYEVAFALIAHDGHETTVDVPLGVGSFSDHAVGGPETVQTQPGGMVRTSFRFENRGNTILDVVVEPAAGETWTLGEPGPARSVPPGAHVVLPIAWDVPLDAPDGQSTHRALVVARSSPAGVVVANDTVEVVVDVARPDLRVLEATAFLGSAGWVVQAIIANEGQRSAHGVDVVLRVGPDAVDGVSIAHIPAGAARNVTLLRPDHVVGPGIVVVNPSGLVPESDTTNNEMLVVERGQGPEASSPAPPLLIVILLFFIPAARAMTTRPRRL